VKVRPKSQVNSKTGLANPIEPVNSSGSRSTLVTSNPDL
jgi:hypothetical protein